MDPQCLHLIASTFTSSAQYGHFFIPLFWEGCAFSGLKDAPHFQHAVKEGLLFSLQDGHVIAPIITSPFWESLLRFAYQVKRIEIRPLGSFRGISPFFFRVFDVGATISTLRGIGIGASQMRKINLRRLAVLRESPCEE
jgi:hypothetical protein